MGTLGIRKITHKGERKMDIRNLRGEETQKKGHIRGTLI
jgi:hypothetical protein